MPHHWHRPALLLSSLAITLTPTTHFTHTLNSLVHATCKSHRLHVAHMILMTHASPVPTHAHMPMPAHTTRLCMHTHAHAHHQLTHAHTPCTPATHAHRPCTCGPCHPHPCTSTAHVQAPMRTCTANSCPLPTGHTTHMWPTPPSSAHMHCPHIHALSKHSPMPTAYAEVTPPACSPHHPHAHTPNAHHACLPPIANSCMHTHQSLTRTRLSSTHRSHHPCVARTTLT